MQVLGFSVHLLTLFGLVLAIGIVVDDAIVVIENVERIMAQEGVPPAVAADRAMRQVSRALISIVLVLCSVFIPVAFLGGITGLMYKQFAITLAVSVVLSGIVALTLTPALCAVLLKPTDPGRKSGAMLSPLFDRFNRGFRAVTERYLGAAGRVIDRPRTFFAAFAVAVALLFVLVRSVPTGFIPSEDKGFFGMLIELPDNASRQRTEAVVKQVEAFLLKQPAINHVVALVGLNFIQNANQTNAAIMFVMLKPWDERSAARNQFPAVLGAVNGFLFPLQASLSTLYINDFNRYGKTYRVQAEAQARFRQTPEDIGRLYVRGPDQQMVPVSALTRTEFRAGPSVITRFNGFTSALVVGAPGLGKSSGEMLAAVERLARGKYAARGVGYAFSGQSYQERASGGQGGLVFALGLVMVFLVLAAQYESWSIPFAVLLGVPFGTLGALLGVWLRGMANDVYVQIGLIVVVGLAAKNAILIVDFANELRAQGRALRAAALEARRERLPPVVVPPF